MKRTSSQLLALRKMPNACRIVALVTVDKPHSSHIPTVIPPEQEIRALYKCTEWFVDFVPLFQFLQTFDSSSSRIPVIMFIRNLVSLILLVTGSNGHASSLPANFSGYDGCCNDTLTATAFSLVVSIHAVRKINAS